MPRANHLGRDTDRILRLSAISLASGACMLWGRDAGATVVTQDFGVNVDVDTPIDVTIGDGSPSGSAQYSLVYLGAALYGTAAVEGAIVGPAGSTAPKASDLAVGDTVGPSDAFLGLADVAPDTGVLFSATQLGAVKGNSGTSYIGLRFTIDGGEDLYGYETLNGDILTSITYDDAGGSVTIGGAVPEPASLALLAVGAAGVAGLRRRRALGA
jgi:hypothetical protein